MNIGCIVVNYRSAALVSELLRSVSKGSIPSLACIVVVDNNSGDESATLIRSTCLQFAQCAEVTVFESTQNNGFGAGNNFGASQISSYPDRPNVLWLLNPDTLVADTDLEHALRWFESDPAIGIVGTGMVDAAGNPDLAGHRDPSPIGEFVANAGAFGLLRRWSVSDPSLDRSGPVDWVSGASLLIRTSLFEQLGGFDEGFFLYFEEVDLCRRARQAGWKVIYEPRSCIVHLEGSSTGVTRSKPMPSYWYESRRRYFVKHYGVLGLWAADLAWGFGRIVGMLRGRGASACRWRDLWRCDWPVLTGRITLNRDHIRN